MNTRATLRDLGNGATLNDIPDATLNTMQESGFDFAYMLGVWQTGPAGREVSRSNPEWQTEYREACPDLTIEDICGSPFAIVQYTVHSDFGGNSALVSLREKLHKRNIQLILDFVPNHVALDHPWVKTNPEYFISGSEDHLKTQPENWVRTDGGILAHGRDPYFAGWPDTLQLNYANPDVRRAMQRELLRVAELCDGVRCDMAMLLEPEIFERTWKWCLPEGDFAEFWSVAIKTVRDRHPEFVCMAEVYWDLEYQLMCKGFDFTYDKKLYDRVMHKDGRAVREHLRGDLSYQQRCARFLQNHDERTIASQLSVHEHRAAAVTTFFAPGLRFFHQGQFIGAKTKIPVHLSRARKEPVDNAVYGMYQTLLPLLASETVKNGSWHLLDTREAWFGNRSHEFFISYLIESNARTMLVAVNYSPDQGQAYIAIPSREWLTGMLRLSDTLSNAVYDRDSNELSNQGLFLDVTPWTAHIFMINRADA